MKYEITHLEILLCLAISCPIGLISGSYDAVNGGCTGLLTGAIAIIIAVAVYVLAFKKPID